MLFCLSFGIHTFLKLPSTHFGGPCFSSQSSAVCVLCISSGLIYQPPTKRASSNHTLTPHQLPGWDMVLTHQCAALCSHSSNFHAMFFYLSLLSTPCLRECPWQNTPLNWRHNHLRLKVCVTQSVSHYQHQYLPSFTSEDKSVSYSHDYVCQFNMTQLRWNILL